MTQQLNFTGLTDNLTHQIAPTIVSEAQGDIQLPLHNKKSLQVKPASESDMFISLSTCDLVKINNIKKEISNALLAGGDTAVLLLKACKALAMATNDEPFQQDTESKLLNLYGAVWKNKNLTEQRLANAWERYAALFSDEVEQAKIEHEKYIKRLDQNA
jgi:tellurite resistance protein